MCKPKGHRLKLPDLFEAYDNQKPWLQRQGMKHICLKATIKNQHLYKKELDEASKHSNIRLATISIGKEQWVEPQDCGSETGTLRPEYTALDPGHWIPSSAVRPVPKSRRPSQPKTAPKKDRERKKQHRGSNSCRESGSDSQEFLGS